MVNLGQTVVVQEIALNAKMRLLDLMERYEYNNHQVDALKMDIAQSHLILQEAKNSLTKN